MCDGFEASLVSNNKNSEQIKLGTIEKDYKKNKLKLNFHNYPLNLTTNT